MKKECENCKWYKPVYRENGICKNKKSKAHVVNGWDECKEFEK